MKNNCREQEKINALLDGELSREKAEKLQLHIKECPVCQNNLRELKAVNRFLEDFEASSVPEILTGKLLNIPDDKRIAPKFQLPRFSRLAIAASIAVAFFAGVVYADLAINTKATLDYTSEDNTFYSYFEGVE